MKYVEVAIAKQHTGNRFFTYEADDEVEYGSIVRVPFGKKYCLAVVRKKVPKPSFATKTISQVLPYSLPVTSQKLHDWMIPFYPDDNGLITQLFIPGSIVNNPSTRPVHAYEPKNIALPTATEEQKNALAILKNADTKRSLLHGDTGTGKTRVFIEIAQQSIEAGKSVLILTPEIGLTPQLVEEVARHANANVVLYHSNLTPVERRKVWEYSATTKKPTIFIGPRSILFLPFHKLGLIVIDEAHDSSFKQLQSPHYQSIHIASKLAQLHDAKLILSTATPNTEDYYKAQQNNYKIIRMKKTAAGSHAAENKLIDMTDRSLFTKNSFISDELLAAIEAALKKNEQVMLFLNRRGNARLVQCADCGWQLECPHCGLPLTYHKDDHEMRCHSCSYKKPAIYQCESCKSTEIKFKNIGTKALVQEIEKLFPRKIIMRFDADSLTNEKLEDNIFKLKAGEIDIVIGTQLISKGIDLPNLTVVGVVNADSGLNLPDYASEELTFQQLYQVTGRVGRGHKLSKSFIQTRVPEHPIMQAILHRSWENFYEYELAKRNRFVYPPFCYLAVTKISKPKLEAAIEASERLFNDLSKNKKIHVLGPSPSFYEKKDGKYGWQIIIKSPSRNAIVDSLMSIPNGWTIDIDPVSLL